MGNAAASEITIISIVATIEEKAERVSESYCPKRNFMFIFGIPLTNINKSIYTKIPTVNIPQSQISAFKAKECAFLFFRYFSS